MTIQDKLIQLREQAGLTQIDFADILGVSCRVINWIEAGKIFPSERIIVAYCDAVGLEGEAF